MRRCWGGNLPIPTCRCQARAEVGVVEGDGLFFSQGLWGGEPEPWEGNPGVFIETSAVTVMRPFEWEAHWKKRSGKRAAP